MKSETKETKELKSVKNMCAITPRVFLPINTRDVEEKFVPKEVSFEENTKLLEQIGLAIGRNMPVLLVGETGTGKTSLIRHLAFRTHNAFVRVNHNGGTTVEDIVGRWTIIDGQTVWIDGLLVQAAKKGYWYLADEMNAAGAEINFLYHSLLDDDGYLVLAEKGDEVVIPHPNFRFFGSINPSSDYSGVKEMNKALLDRFIVVKVDFPDPVTEARILVQRSKIKEDVAQKMVQFAGQVRIMKQKEDIDFVFSTRSLIMWADMYKIYKKYIVAAETTFINKIAPKDVEAINVILGLSFQNEDDRATKKKTEEDANTSTEVPF